MTPSSKLGMFEPQSTDKDMKSMQIYNKSPNFLYFILGQKDFCSEDDFIKS